MGSKNCFFFILIKKIVEPVNRFSQNHDKLILFIPIIPRSYTAGWVCEVIIFAKQKTFQNDGRLFGRSFSVIPRSSASGIGKTNHFVLFEISSSKNLFLLISIYQVIKLKLL